jgi:hypothetical protein
MYCHLFVCETYKIGSGLDDWICWHLIHRTRNYRQYSATADLQTLEFTITHAIGILVFTSRILTTDIPQPHCHFKSHMKSSCHSLIPFLPFLLNHLRLPSPELGPILDNSNSNKSKSHCDWRSVSQSVSKSWCRAPSGAHDQILVLFLWGALSDERTGLSFVYAVGPCQRSLFRVQVPWNSRPYFTVSDLRLSFSSPLTTRRVTVEVSLYNLSARTTQKQPSCWEGLFTDLLHSNGRPVVSRVRFRGNVFTELLPSNGSVRHTIIFRL